MGICVIIPAYNAAHTIRQVALETLQAGLPVVVVDDGSGDDTAAAISGLPVNLCRHPRNLGKGAALRTGFAWGAQHGFAGFVTLDADGQHDPAAIPALIATARERGLDLVLGSRQAVHSPIKKSAIRARGRSATRSPARIGRRTARARRASPPA